MSANEMIKRHESLGAVFSDDGFVKSYGDYESEYRAARKAAGLMDLSNRDRLSLRGKDSVSFLNNMVTNDIRLLKPGMGLYACLLNPKGHIITDMRVHRGPEDELILDLEMGLGDRLRDHLEKHKFRSEVEISSLKESLGHFYLVGKDV
ncbi:MAG: aminomethyl transferase family protein, partial [Spirochaetota bacterium]|nr:aminomethyl transferase family protein [Spirochaetota bacterium]